MSRLVARLSVSTPEVARAAIGAPELFAAAEKRVRRQLGPDADTAEVSWIARGRGVNGEREEAWSPGWAVPWWAATLTCFAVVER